MKCNGYVCRNPSTLGYAYKDMQAEGVNSTKLLFSLLLRRLTSDSVACKEELAIVKREYRDYLKSLFLPHIAMPPVFLKRQSRGFSDLDILKICVEKMHKLYTINENRTKICCTLDTFHFLCSRVIVRQTARKTIHKRSISGGLFGCGNCVRQSLFLLYGRLSCGGDFYGQWLTG